MALGKYYFGFLIFELCLLLGLLLHSCFTDSTLMKGKTEIVHTLGLTDFAIWTEARYTRHPSQTDFFSPFQDLPATLEHFPAGSVIGPPHMNKRL